MKIAILTIAALLLIGCERAKLLPPSAEEGKTSAATALESPAGNINVATIAVHSSAKTTNVSVEIASTNVERARGLMGRESLAPNYGMWFVFPEDVREPFWMKDTLIPLDIIFVDSEMKIVDIIARAEAGSTELLVPKASYRYVLEVAGGYAASNGIEVGDHVEQRIGPAQ